MDALDLRTKVMADAENHSPGPKGWHFKNHDGKHFPEASELSQKQHLEKKEAGNSKNL